MAEARKLKVYYIDPELPQEVPLETLVALGVKTWQLDADKFEDDPELEAIRKEQGYSYHDFAHSKDIPNLAQKLDMFKTEHLHLDDEIRYFLDGSGYFDVRDGNREGEPWIRIHAFKGDMITLPAGIYHRFVPDEQLNFHVMRLFQGEPVWTSFNRGEQGTEDQEARAKYVKSFLSR